MNHAKYLTAIACAAVLFSGAVYAADDKTSDDVEAQLQAARQKLEQAAHEVAELSERLGRPLMERMMVMGVGPKHAVIGVQLDAKSSKDGAIVGEVSPGGPAAEAGIHGGDVIVSVNGTDVRGANPSAEVAHLLQNVEPNGKVKLHILREGKSLDIEVTARSVGGEWGMPPLPHGIPFEGLPELGFLGAPHTPLGGMELVTLTPQLGSYFGTDKGVLVVRAPHGAAVNLQDGDVILAIDGREPTSGSHATRILASYQAGEKVKLELMRQRKKLNVEMPMPELHRHSHERLAADDDSKA